MGTKDSTYGAQNSTIRPKEGWQGREDLACWGLLIGATVGQVEDMEGRNDVEQLTRLLLLLML
jgi:hypothetical protein